MYFDSKEEKTKTHTSKKMYYQKKSQFNFFAKFNLCQFVFVSLFISNCMFTNEAEMEENYSLNSWYLLSIRLCLCVFFYNNQTLIVIFVDLLPIVQKFFDF